jgi:hypothetical protein
VGCSGEAGGLRGGANRLAAKAAVIHDYLYTTRGLFGRFSRGHADAVFRQALGDCGVPAWKRMVLWIGVRLGGGGGWGDQRSLNARTA